MLRRMHPPFLFKADFKSAVASCRPTLVMRERRMNSVARVHQLPILPPDTPRVGVPATAEPYRVDASAAQLSWSLQGLWGSSEASMVALC